MTPHFSLDTSLGIGLVLAVLPVLAFLAVLLAGRCRHEYLTKYDGRTRRVYGECRHCQQVTAGWPWPVGLAQQPRVAPLRIVARSEVNR